MPVITLARYHVANGARGRAGVSIAGKGKEVKNDNENLGRSIYSTRELSDDAQ